MLLAMVASLAIVVSDHASVRSTPRSSATELTTLWQGDVVEVRGEQAEYLKVYSYRRERGGYLRGEAVRRVSFTEADAPELLAVMRFLRDTPGSEALGISYGAAYLKAAPPRALTAEAFDAIGQMAERLADTASGSGSQATSVAARLEVVSQFGVRMRSFERNGRMQVCYDGELYRNVLMQPTATAEQRAHAVLGLTRADCIEPDVGPTARAALDDERRALLDGVPDAGLLPATRSRVRARRAAVWSAITFAQARHGKPAGPSGQHALADLTAVRPSDLGELYQGEYVDAVLRVSAIRWAAATAVIRVGAASPNAAVPLVLAQATAATPAQPVQPAAATAVNHIGIASPDASAPLAVARSNISLGPFAVGKAQGGEAGQALGVSTVLGGEAGQVLGVSTVLAGEAGQVLGVSTVLAGEAGQALGVSTVLGGDADQTLDLSGALGRQAGQPLGLGIAPGTEAGQTCVALEQSRQQRPKTLLARRCTFGIVWLASAQVIPQAQAVVLSVQPLESWRELWVFHQIAGKWLVDVLSPGLDDPDEGYVDYAGFAPGTSRILLVREVKERGRFRRWFEEVRLDDLILVRQASTPELLRDFGRWQDIRWRRETLALR